MNKFFVKLSVVATVVVALALVSCDEDKPKIVLDPCECYTVLSGGDDTHQLYDTCNQALHVNDAFKLSYTKCQYAAITGADTADVVIPQNTAPKINIAEDGTYIVDTEESQIRFIGRNQILNKSHKGSFKVSSGTLVVRDSALIEGNIIIDVTSLVEESTD
ncbi:MAG: hypothetical protein HKN32_09900, partial [Flavobacteriales bacterium]|nr:hypothetical protein [Flavobacteriales bacterium]